MKIVKVEEDYQKGYSYSIQAPVGKQFDAEFKPELTPKEMLSLGIFSGNYFNSLPKEFPASWFEGVNLSPKNMPDDNSNFFKVRASQSLSVWQKNGWIYFEDPLGWFLWYCRYYMGRRIAEEDRRQIKRWKAIRRHVAQIQKNCQVADLNCHPRQRQALLHWAYDSRKI
jgi:hypothetical protein